MQKKKDFYKICTVGYPCFWQNAEIISETEKYSLTGNGASSLLATLYAMEQSVKGGFK